MKKLFQKIKTAQFFLKKKKIIAVCRVFYGDEWMELALSKIEPFVEKILIVKSSKTWNETNYEPDDISPILDRLQRLSNKYVLLEDDWGDQWQQQDKIWNLIRTNYSDFTHFFYIDSDEIYEESDLRRINKLIRSPKYFNRALRVNMYTYIKRVEYRVFPLESYKPIAIIPLLDYVRFNEIRSVEGCPIELAPVFMHHFSLVRKNEERIKQKLDNKGIDSFELVDNWYERFFLNFSPKIKNFHTLKGHEHQWKEIEVVSEENLPKGVMAVYKSWNKSNG